MNFSWRKGLLVKFGGMCYIFTEDKPSRGARGLFRLAGRIGKQVQDLRGTAAVMEESRLPSVPLCDPHGKAMQPGRRGQSRKTCPVRRILFQAPFFCGLSGRTRAADGPNVCTVSFGVRASEKEVCAVFVRVFALAATNGESPLFVCGFAPKKLKEESL